jgi:hypothetical protein
MRHWKPQSILLLGACSQCKKSFEDGVTRHMVGYYPMEQFCTYQCVEKFLNSDHGLKRALHLPPGGDNEETPKYL